MFELTAASLIFSVVFFVSFVLLVCSLENHNIEAALGVVLFILGANEICGPYSLVKYVYKNPLESFCFLIAYFIIGLLWACIKWVLFVKNRRREVKAYYKQWLESNGYRKDMPFDSLEVREKESFLERAKIHFSQKDVEKAPSFEENLNRFMVWMLFWELSVLSTFLLDFISFVLSLVSKKMQSISERIWSSDRI